MLLINTHTYSTVQYNGAGGGGEGHQIIVGFIVKLIQSAHLHRSLVMGPSLGLCHTIWSSRDIIATVNINLLGETINNLTYRPLISRGPHLWSQTVPGLTPSIRFLNPPPQTVEQQLLNQGRGRERGWEE